jgi:type II secretory pathway pseudopilin PulG
MLASAHSQHRVAAFTFIEFLLVLSTIVVLAAIAVPRFGRSLGRYRVEAAGERIVADLAYAQSTARAASSGRSIVFSTVNDHYSMPGVEDIDRSGNSYTVKLGAEPYAVSIESVSLPGFAGSHTLTFDGYGMPDHGGSIVLASGDFTVTVEIDAETGRASVP